MLKIIWTKEVVAEANRIERAFNEIDGSDEGIVIERYGTEMYRWGTVSNNRDGSGEVIINDAAIIKIVDLVCSFMSKLQPVITLLNSMVPWIKKETNKIKEEFTNSILCYYVVDFDFNNDHKFAIIELDEFENRKMINVIGTKEERKCDFSELHRVAEYQDLIIRFETKEEAEEYMRTAHKEYFLKK